MSLGQRKTFGRKMTFQWRPGPGLQEALNEKTEGKAARVRPGAAPALGSRPPTVTWPRRVPGTATPLPPEGAAGPPSPPETPRPQTSGTLPRASRRRRCREIRAEGNRGPREPRGVTQREDVLKITDPPRAAGALAPSGTACFRRLESRKRRRRPIPARLFLPSVSRARAVPGWREASGLWWPIRSQGRRMRRPRGAPDGEL